MFTKYRKARNQRLLFIDNTIMIEEGSTIIAIGRENKEFSNEKTIAFDIAYINEADKEMIKRFVRTALTYANEKRKLNYSFLKENSLNFKPTLTFSRFLA